MRSARPLSLSILSLLIVFFSVITTARADDDYEEDYDVKARVVRISLIDGDVNLKRNGNTDWERAKLNFPLVEGDTLTTSERGRLELQIDARNYVRVGPGSILRIVTLRDQGIALSLVEGTATIRLAKFDRDDEYFEIDAPKTTVAAEKKGFYRIDVAREGRVSVTVRNGGRARVYSDTSGFQVREGKTAQLVFEGPDAGDWQLLDASTGDAWDRWVDDRERYLAGRSHYDTQYYDQYVWGGEDLDAYGNWLYTSDYGWIWQPSASLINGYGNWAPYRYGNWIWCQPYGWTWVGYEPWGWAPYHYGRWVYYNNYWAWCPRSNFYRKRSWWRPALVAFSLEFGNDVCWYPLSYYHRDPHSRHNQQPDRLTPLTRRELENLRRVNPSYARAVTTVPAKELGSDRNLRAATDLLSRRVVNEEPLRDLPVRPASAASTEDEQSGRITVARPARLIPAVQVPARETGATTRTPGAPLDEELRRSRVYNGREPRTNVPNESSSTPAEARPTGAVARPSRQAPAENQSGDSGNDNARPSRDRSDDSGNDNARPARATPARNDNERPAVTERPADSKRPDRTEPSRRDVDSAPARPARSNDSDRSERPSRSETRSEPSRSEPSRSEPSRSEPSRSEPARSEPSRSEPSRSEPSRSEPSKSDSSSKPDRPGRP